MELQLKEAVDTVKGLNDTLNTRLGGMEAEILAMKRNGRIAGETGDVIGAETKALANFFRKGETKALSCPPKLGH
ncbi:hypothetical protein [uncultured Roseovarius sp.]|uniref:hypothetical protein n=1 Tax=uncultured Roseovarius sp. TaxID=293344 RepID=UPI002605BEBA|nr:hypothetical protein [uncultured Roseovarius sp.]